MSGMSGMDMGSSNSTTMSSSGINMVFFSSSTTPLYSNMWSPTSTASYAGTCIFLILLATAFRGLIALAYLFEKRETDRARSRRYVVVHGKPTVGEQIASDASAKTGVLVTERGSEENVRVVTKNVRAPMAWRWSTDLPRAALRTVTAGVGYLL